MDAQANVEGLDEALRALRRMSKEGQKELRAEVQKMTERHAKAIRGAVSSDPRWRHISPTVRAKKDRVPVIQVGMARRAPIRGNPRIYDLIYGVEFGSNDWRFPPRTPQLNGGNAGYTIFPALRGRQSEIVNEWEAVVDRVTRKWAD